MAEYKIGDRVVCNHPFSGLEKNKVYIIEKIEDYNPLYMPDASFVKVEGVDGFWYPSRFNKVIEEKIEIYRDKDNPNKVISKNLWTGDIGVARCHPHDIFDFNTGAYLAFKRMTGSKMSTEKVKFYTGKVICVRNLSSLAKECHTIGKVYNIVDGILYDNTNVPWDFYRVKSVDDLNKFMHRMSNQLMCSEFIEFKGGNDK